MEPRPTQYLVERYVPRGQWKVAGECCRQLERAVSTQAADGDGIRYLGSIFVPGEEWCLSLFEGGTEDALRGVLESAGFTDAHIAVAQLVRP